MHKWDFPDFNHDSWGGYIWNLSAVLNLNGTFSNIKEVNSSILLSL